MNEPTKAVTHPAAQAVQAKRDIRDFIQSDTVKQQMALVLPKHLTPDRMARVALTAFLRTPKLLDCTRESLLQALMTCSQAGLEPDGRNAHLIPYKDVVQVIFDYKGIVELAMRSGVVANIHADVICEEDEFEYDLGKIAKHKINFRKPRGEVYAVYAIVRFKDGTEKCEVMTREDVEGIRKRSRAANAGPWVTDWNEMAKKTVFRRLSKWITLSPEFRDAVDKDDDTVVPAQVVEPVKPLFEALPEAASTVAAETQPEKPLTNGKKGTNMPEPGPVETPAEAAKKQPPAAPAPAGSHELRAMPGLLKLAGVEESEVIALLHRSGVDDSLATLADVDTMAHAALKHVHDNWSAVVQDIKNAKAKKETLL